MLIKYKKIHFLIEIVATVEWRHRFLKSLARVVFLLMWEGMLCCCTYRIQKYRQRFSFPPHRKHTPGVFFKKPRNFSWKFFLLSFFRCCCFKCHCRFVYYKEASEYVFNWCYSFPRPSAGIFHLKKKGQIVPPPPIWCFWSSLATECQSLTLRRLNVALYQLNFLSKNIY